MQLYSLSKYATECSSFGATCIFSKDRELYSPTGLVFKSPECKVVATIASCIINLNQKAIIYLPGVANLLRDISISIYRGKRKVLLAKEPTCSTEEQLL